MRGAARRCVLVGAEYAHLTGFVYFVSPVSAVVVVSGLVVVEV